VPIPNSPYLPDQMLITVYIPTIGRYEYLKESLDSVLSQTRRPDELIVNFNGAQIPPWFEEYKVRCHQYGLPLKTLQTDYRLSVTASWFSGIEAARNEFVCVCGDDDILKNDFIQTAFDHLNSDERIDVYACNFQRINSSGTAIEGFEYDSGDLPEGLSWVDPLSVWYRKFPPIMSCVFRKNRFLMAFAHSANLALDLWTFMEMAQSGYWLYFDKAKRVNYRCHETSMSSSKSALLLCDALNGLKSFESKYGHLPRAHKEIYAQSIWRSFIKAKSAKNMTSLIFASAKHPSLLCYTLMDLVKTIYSKLVVKGKPS
jgi:glycosyltransferase involved in cell wall biosynthesis